MRCPYCREADDKVVDSRVADDGDAIRRRRECLACGRRFTTYERLDRLGRMLRRGLEEALRAKGVSVVTTGEGAVFTELADELWKKNSKESGQIHR